METKSLFADSTLLTFEYSSAGALKRITDKKRRSTLEIDSGHLLLDGQKMATWTQNSFFDGSNRFSFSYDENGRLLSITENGQFVTHFGIDTNGSYSLSPLGLYSRPR